MARNLVVTVLVSVVMAGFVLAYISLTQVQAVGMKGMNSKGPVVPPVRAFMEGEEILFIHTEASDPKLAKMLTDMMGGSPVLVVPSLAQAPAAMLANVYVFKNGIKGGGPLNFQPDVFDRPPNGSGYSPLRNLNLTAWKDGRSARVLKTAAEVKSAERKGEIEITKPGIVVNMPLLTWPGGSR